MTLKEQIMKLQTYKMHEGEDTVYVERDDALKVLEQQPCEDCISRKLLSDNICEGISCNECSFNEIDGESGCLLQKRLDELPSVQPKPKTGHWIEHPEIETSTPEYLMFYECSECGDKQCFCKSDIHKKHFCNNCGAKMVEPQESEENNG